MSDTDESTLQDEDKIFQNLLASDELLKDIPPDITVDELKNLIAEEKGEALSLVLRLVDGEEIDLRTRKNAVFRDLQVEIKKALIQRITKTEHYHHRISWKYVWSKWDLRINGVLFNSSQKTLKDVGAKSGNVIEFFRKKSTKGSRLKSIH